MVFQVSSFRLRYFSQGSMRCKQLIEPNLQMIYKLKIEIF